MAAFPETSLTEKLYSYPRVWVFVWNEKQLKEEFPLKEKKSTLKKLKSCILGIWPYKVKKFIQ